MSLPEFQHWGVEYDMDHVCWLTLDRQAESVNSLSREVLSELEDIVGHLEKQAPRGVILQSGKPGSFIVGADVREFESFDRPETAAEAVREVHQLFNRIEALAFPVVVAVDGLCLGGGLELALACHYRVARNTENTRFGFPEIKLGIYPGFGGSARTTQMFGGPKALELMLGGRMLHATAAHSLGLVDQLVGPHQELRWAARRAVLQGRKSRRAGIMAHLSNIAPARKIFAGIISKQAAARANPKHYPAPGELITAWQQSGNSKRAMMSEEVTRVSALLTGDASRGLRRVFSLMELLKAEGKKSNFSARRVHVIGAGVMGGDIAAWCVLRGLDVSLQDREMKYVQPALERANRLFQRRLKTRDQVAGARSRLTADIAGHGVARADVVIEAIFENADAKRGLFSGLEARLKPGAILATNTSAIPLAEIASGLQQPQRLLGLHFFNPVAKMPLVEVVHDSNTDLTEVGHAAAFCVQIDRLPLLVKSSPGFLVNRVLAPYMQKALQIHRERDVPKEALDQAAVEFGMPMGPVELADTVGLDVGLKVMSMLSGNAAADDIAVIQSMVESGKLGKKSGQGFYRWKNGSPVKHAAAAKGINLQSLAEELMQAYFDECRACLADGIVAHKDLLDAGMIFGTGFAPFRGGPLNYLEQRAVRSHEESSGRQRVEEQSHDN